MEISKIIMQSIEALGNSQQDVDILGSLQLLFRKHGVDMNRYHKHPIDIVEEESVLTVYMDIPGVEKKSLDLNFYNNEIEIFGTRTCPYKISAQTAEIQYSDFTKKITLPINVTRSDNVSISTEDGVLKIVITKDNEKQTKFNIRLDNDRDNIV